jgi:diacylglycerol kinase
LRRACVVSIEPALIPAKIAGLDRVIFGTYSIRALRQSWIKRRDIRCIWSTALAIVFFFMLPVTDAKTVRMKLSVLSSLGMPLATLVVVPHLPH